MHRSPPRSHQNFPDSKNSKITVIYNDTVHCLIEMKVVRNNILNNLYLNDKLHILHCSLYGSSQFFKIWPNSVLIEIKVVRNDVINNFKLRNQLSRIHCFHSQESLKMAKFSHFAEKLGFWSTSEAFPS